MWYGRLIPKEILPAYNKFSAGLREVFILGREYSEHERLSKLNLLPLQYRREIHDLVFFLKCFENMYNLDILDFVSSRTCNKPLRKIDYLTLNVPFSRTETFKNSYFIRVCRSWN